MPDSEIVGHDEVPLTTADVEREFATTNATRAALTPPERQARQPNHGR